jgi:hypothetical protein
VGVTDQLPSVGRIVHYRLSDDERGNAVRAGDVLPLIVAAVYAEYKSVEAPHVVNGQVVLDLIYTLWVTSRQQGGE